MRIDKRYKVRNVVNEHVVIIQDNGENEMAKMMALNETSYLLWTSLENQDFEIQDVQQVLLNNFNVDPEVALKDATEWVNTLKENGIIL